MRDLSCARLARNQASVPLAAVKDSIARLNVSRRLVGSSIRASPLSKLVPSAHLEFALRPPKSGTLFTPVRYR